jgi:hypothetical protein
MHDFTTHVQQVNVGLIVWVKEGVSFCSEVRRIIGGPDGVLGPKEGG